MTTNIIRFTPYETETIVGFFDVELDLGDGNRITLRGLKLIKSKRQDQDYFIGVPQYQHNDNWYSHYQLQGTILDDLTKLAITKFQSK